MSHRGQHFWRVRSRELVHIGDRKTRWDEREDGVIAATAERAIAAVQRGRAEPLFILDVGCYGEITCEDESHA